MKKTSDKAFKIIHNREDCIGCGACAGFCPKFWELDIEDIKANLKGANNDNNPNLDITADDLECNMQAAESCPVNIIHIVDLKTKKKLI